MRLAPLVASALSVLLVAASAVRAADLSEKDVTLLEALTDKDVPAAQKAIAAGANPNFINDDDLTPLGFSIATGDAKMVDALLAAGADPARKDSKGKSAIDLATEMHTATILASLNAAATKRPGVAPAPTIVATPQPAPAAAPAADATPAKPLSTVHDAFAGTSETGTFDDVQFKTPDPKKWTSKVVEDNLVFSAPLPPPDFCTLTVYASRDFKGDDAAFLKQFDDLVQASLKKTKTKKVENDSGPKRAGEGKSDLVAYQRVLICEAEDFHVCHFFVAMHSGDRMELLAYQSSGMETFKGNMEDANAFLSSLKINTSRTLNP